VTGRGKNPPRRFDGELISWSEVRYNSSQGENRAFFRRHGKERVDLIQKLRKMGWGLAAMIVLAVGFVVFTRPTQTAPATSELALRQKIAQFVRARFGLLDTVKLTVEPLQDFGHGGFYKSTLSSDDGKQKKTHNLVLSRDERYLILGEVFSLGGDPKNEIAHRVRENFKIPPATIISVGDFRKSNVPNLLATTITVQNGNQKQQQDFFVTSDKTVLLLGTVFNLASDPRLEALRVITTENQPSVGPANAPVTIVEFADLQCASCSHMHEFLEKQLVPKYGNKVRVVFKEFPLASMHDWALTGAIASQCVYQINPSAFITFRSMIFKNQTSLNAANARNLLIDYGEQAGIDRLRLAACIDSKATLPRVQESFREGDIVGVKSTPTIFINGKMMVGLPGPEVVYKAVDEALRAAR
jgi:protein-disulfide isomerase